VSLCGPPRCIARMQAFGMAAVKAEEVLTSVAVPVDLTVRDHLVTAATTSLSSKVVSASSEDLAPLAVDAVLAIMNSGGVAPSAGAAAGGAGSATAMEAPPTDGYTVDLSNIKVVKALGGTIDETELVHGLVFTNKVSHMAGAPTRIAGAKIGLAQFHLSAPKTDIEVRRGGHA